MILFCDLLALTRCLPGDTLYYLNAQDDDFLVEMSTPEEILRRCSFRHPSRYRREPSLSSLHQNPCGMATGRIAFLPPEGH